jgi:hypothetical protein
MNDDLVRELKRRSMNEKRFKSCLAAFSGLISLGRIVEKRLDGMYQEYDHEETEEEFYERCSIQAIDAGDRFMKEYEKTTSGKFDDETKESPRFAPLPFLKGGKIMVDLSNYNLEIVLTMSTIIFLIIITTSIIMILQRNIYRNSVSLKFIKCSVYRIPIERFKDYGVRIIEVDKRPPNEIFLDPPTIGSFPRCMFHSNIRDCEKVNRKALIE